MLVWVAIALLACGRPAKAQPVPGPTRAAGLSRFASTAELVPDPQVALLVERLAAQTVVESAHVGAMGGPSATFEIFQKLRAAATGPQMRTLLRHQSPVVRGYVVKYFAGGSDEDLAALAPLLDDDTEVDVQDGCIGSGSSICRLVLEKINPARVEDRLLQIAGTTGNDCPALALRTLAVLKNHAIRSIAESILSDPKRAPLGIDVLGKLGAQESAAKVRQLAESTDLDVRSAVAQALAAWPSPESEAVLSRLLEDAEVRVRSAAVMSYLKQKGRDLKRIQTRWRTEHETVRLSIEIGLAHDGRPDALALLRSGLVPKPRLHPDFWRSLGNLAYSGQFPSPSFIALLRGLLARGAPRSVEQEAIEFLTRWERAKADPATPFR